MFKTIVIRKRVHVLFFRQTFKITFTADLQQKWADKLVENGVPTSIAVQAVKDVMADIVELIEKV
jgi:hypothetical protein